MKTSHIIIILVIIISSSIIFTISFEPSFQQEHYDIEIFGPKDVYLVGEPYSFSYTISGYGYSCADREITYPNENGNTVRNNIDVDCNTGTPKTKFIIDSKDESEMQSISIKNPGRYGVSIMFEKSPPTHIEPTQYYKEFHVVEKICDDSNLKDRAQCFEESYKSCESAYMTQQFSTENGGIVNLKAVVESWYDCTLRVYTENSLDEHTPFNGMRSICENMTVDETSLNFENCNNADYPPIMFTLQESELDSKTLECYALFHCNDKNQNFEECINSYQHGFTVKSMCQFSNVTVNDGCVDITFSNDSRMVSCD